MPRAPQSSSLVPYTTLFRSDFSPIVRGIQAANPDVVSVCSYPLDSVSIVRAVSELNYKPKMIGDAMVGLDRKSTRLTSHSSISYAVFCLKKKKHKLNRLAPE